MDLKLKQYPVQILTSHFMVTGTFTPRGDPFIFLNDDGVTTFAITEATITPLTPGAGVGDVSIPELRVPKREAQIFIIGDYTAQEARPLPKTGVMSCFTNAYVVHGEFHMSPEVTPQDLFFVQKGPFYVATTAEVYSLIQLTTEVSGEADMLFVNGQSVEVFYIDK